MAKQQRMALVTVLALWCALAPAGWAADVPAAALWAITLLSLLTAARRLAIAARALRG